MGNSAVGSCGEWWGGRSLRFGRLHSGHARVHASKYCSATSCLTLSTFGALVHGQVLAMSAGEYSAWCEAGWIGEQPAPSRPASPTQINPIQPSPAKPNQTKTNLPNI